MNCRDFQSELEERAGLSDAATLHFKDCADCGKLHRNQTRIWQMIESLPSIAAPTDFNSKFRARVATAKASDFRPAWWKSLRYAVPVFAVVLVLTMIFASQNFFVSTSQPEELAIIQKDEKPPVSINKDAEAKTTDSNIAAINSNVSPDETNSLAKVEKTPAPKTSNETQNAGKEKSAPESDDSGGGSRDFGVKPGSPPILPNGLTQSETGSDLNPNGMMNPKGQNIEEMLSFFGVETTSENGKLRVISVIANSIAARSGLKSGDLIEAIDGKSVSGADRITTFNSLTILRGNERIKIVNRAQ